MDQRSQRYIMVIHPYYHVIGMRRMVYDKSRFVQFRMIGEMIRLLGDSAGKGEKGEKHISSFQAFAVSLASRVGTGNLAGVATAVAIGGPGSVFWMWLIALLGSSSAFVESTLAQLYKEKGKTRSLAVPLTICYMVWGYDGWGYYLPY